VRRQSLQPVPRRCNCSSHRSKVRKRLDCQEITHRSNERYRDFAPTIVPPSLNLSAKPRHENRTWSASESHNALRAEISLPATISQWHCARIEFPFFSTFVAYESGSDRVGSNPKGTLLTGGAGFVRSHVAEALLRHGIQLHLLGYSPQTSMEQGLRSFVAWYRAKLTDSVP
jgi:hypothetical protein